MKSWKELFQWKFCLSCPLGVDSKVRRYVSHFQIQMRVEFYDCLLVFIDGSHICCIQEIIKAMVFHFQQASSRYCVSLVLFKLSSAFYPPPYSISSLISFLVFLLFYNELQCDKEAESALWLVEPRSMSRGMKYGVR